MKKKKAETEFERELSSAVSNFDKLLIAKRRTNPPTTAEPRKRVNVFSPKNVGDAQSLIDCLRQKEGIVVSLSSVKPQTAQRLLDFLCGAVYAMKGTVTVLEDKLYLFTPEGVDVATKDKNEIFG